MTCAGVLKEEKFVETKILSGTTLHMVGALTAICFFLSLSLLLSV
jgi:hypothetical protein